MKKIKLKIVLKIKKILENQLTKMNKISHNIQSDILLENAEKQKQIFLKKFEQALENGFASSPEEKSNYNDIIEEAKNGDNEAYLMLRNVPKYNESFKKETSIFKNI
jgi:hypothetical protein